MHKKICLLLLIADSLTAQALIINPSSIQTIGKKIWHNECKGTIDGLTHWNDGEEFASLGIGHFIWYPATKKPRLFQETFPSLVTFLQTKKAPVPAWLAKTKTCPWHTRQEFIAAHRSVKMQELRTLLATTVNLQTEFIIKNLADHLEKKQKELPKATFDHIKKQFYRVAKNPNGIYALIDYANFKGVGFNPREQYNNHGWGLFHVLQTMKGTSSETALAEFCTVAKQILTTRVQNAPQKRNEARWLPGWLNRIDTYLKS
ncbi:MAG: hypothetical protein AB7R69_04650 [Candidatus Babeliales bacterium]